MTWDPYPWTGYDRMAAQYALVRKHWVLSPEMTWFAQHGLGQGPILDAGCGPGRDLGPLLRLGHPVIGLDASPAMLKLAAESCDDADDIRLVQGDLRELPLPSASCAGIWCSTVLPHLNRLELVRALSEFWRVLSDDGLLVATFKIGTGEGLEVADDLLGVSRWVRYSSKAELEELVAAEGFRIVELAEWTESTRFPDGGRAIDFISVAARPTTATVDNSFGT